MVIEIAKPIDGMLSELTQAEEKYNDYEFPKISIIIPTFNCVQSITPTLENILAQDYPDFEVIIVDAGSTDRTLEAIKGFRNDKIYIYSVSGYQRYIMLNKGITQSSGVYINILFPGDFYISKESLKHMMCLALDHDKPHLVYCGTLLRDGKSEVKILYRLLSLKLLRRGQQPTSLQSMWFRSDTFRALGKFNNTYNLRGSYEFLCRFSLDESMQFASTTRILTDYDLRFVTRKLVILHFWETMRTIFHYFGLWATLQWLTMQKDTARFGRLWFRSLRTAFLGR